MKPAPTTVHIIGLCGLATAGKSTAAAAFYGWERASFAAPIRAMLAALGLTAEDMGERGKNVPLPWLGGKTPRQLMQSLGTEWGREQVSPDIWLALAERRISCARAAAFAANFHGIVFDDVRFDNEAALLRSLGGKVLRIERDGLAPSMTHASERGVSLDLVDGTIINLGRDATAFGRDAVAAAHRALGLSP